MKKLIEFTRKLCKDGERQGNIEYALILTCITLEVVFILGAVGNNLSGKFTEIGGLIH